MARLSDGGGGGSFGSSFGSGFSGIGNVAKSAAKKSVKKKKSSGSGVHRAVSHGSNSVNNIGRSVSRSARRSSNRSSNSGRSYSNNNYRAATTPRVSVPRPPVGNTPAGTIAKSVPPPPPPISPQDFLAKDTTYKSQQSAYQKALADYATQMAAEQGKYNGEYDASVKQLGLDRSEGMTSLKDDYASRGLINSGVYGDALGDLTKKYDTSQADLERAKQAYMSDLTTGQTNFQGTQAQLLEKAKQEALQRRLSQIGG